MQQVTNNLTAAEMDALTNWIADGGSLLVISQAIGRADETNLPELLRRFGLLVFGIRRVLPSGMDS